MPAKAVQQFMLGTVLGNENGITTGKIIKMEG